MKAIAKDPEFTLDGAVILRSRHVNLDGHDDAFKKLHQLEAWCFHIEPKGKHVDEMSKLSRGPSLQHLVDTASAIYAYRLVKENDNYGVMSFDAETSEISTSLYLDPKLAEKAQHLCMSAQSFRTEYEIELGLHPWFRHPDAPKTNNGPTIEEFKVGAVAPVMMTFFGLAPSHRMTSHD